MHCNECRSRLPEHLSGELDGLAERSIAAHLAECAECRSALDRIRRTTEALDAWSPIESSADARLIAAAAARAHRPRRRRLRGAAPWLGGLAAGVLLFIGLSILGTQASWSGGRLVVSFGGAAQGTDAELVSLIRDEVDEERALTLQAIEGAFQEWRRREDDRYLNLMRAMQTARNADQQLVARAFAEVAEDSRETRDALDGVIRLVALDQTRSIEDRRIP